jgi:Ca2+-binding RTX toxin-like protein
VAATLFGGGSGDQLFAAGSAAHLLLAGSGNETLSGTSSSGNNVFYAGSGSDSMGGGSGIETFIGGHGSATMLGGTSADLYGFVSGLGGGTDEIANFDAGKGDRLTLQGYGSNAVTTALSGAQVTGSNTMLTLADNTRIELLGVSNLTSANFV